MKRIWKKKNLLQIRASNISPKKNKFYSFRTLKLKLQATFLTALMKHHFNFLNLVLKIKQPKRMIIFAKSLYYKGKYANNSSPYAKLALRFSSPNILWIF